MKKQLLLLLLFLSSLNIFAQIDFEKGFYIDNNNNKVECLIKNQDWMGIPSKIEYKISESSQTETIDFSMMNGFQVYNSSHYYIKAEIDVDRNNDVADFKPKKVATVLKVLIDGLASLYSSSDIFFYKINDGAITQLVYKKYVDDNSKIKQDNVYQKELYENLKCENNIVEIRKLRYKHKELIAFFKNYNECKSFSYKTFASKRTKAAYHFNIIAGATFSKGTFTFPDPSIGGGIPSSGSSNYLEEDDAKSESYEPSFIIGMEAEILLPFNKNKWSIFIAPNYQQSNFEMLNRPQKNVNLSKNASVSYSYIDIPIGVRHYFNLNENSQLFLDAAMGYSVLLNAEESTYTKVNADTLYYTEIDNQDSVGTSFKIGVGYNVNKKYGFSLNYYPSKKLSRTTAAAFSLTAFYTLF